MQKVPVATPEKEGGGRKRQRRGIRKKIVEKKTEELSDYMKRAVNLVHMYVPPDPGRIQRSKDAGKASIQVLSDGTEYPARIALDDLAERYGIEVPLVDFLYTDPYAVLTEGVRHGRYLGLHRAAGVLCHHLAFVQDTIEWQIWIDAGEEPLPRKFVITYVREPGEPQYAAVFRRWSLEPEFPEGLFSFRAPPGAEEVEFSRFVSPDLPPEPGRVPPGAREMTQSRRGGGER